MRTLYLAWQDSDTRRWFPIGQLTENIVGRYQFCYVRGVVEAMRESQFHPLPSFPSVNRVYESKELFPLFVNRVMPETRPDYPNYVHWLGLSGNEKDPLSYLEHSGGRKATDTLEVFPAAAKRPDGAYEFDFFLHGLRHMSPDSVARADNLEPGERLLLMRDVQNPKDEDAIALRTYNADSGDSYLMGYCPRYLSAEIRQALEQDKDSCQVNVVRVNLPPAPVQLRLLCRMMFEPRSKVVPFSADGFKPLTNEASTTDETR